MPVTDRFRLDGKVAVVTGASRNIGLAIARAFAEAGAVVVMVARGAETLTRAAEAIGGTTETITADIGRQEDVERLIARVHGRHGQADILVNNAFADGRTVGTNI